MPPIVLPINLSWSALLEGQRYVYLEPKSICDLAKERIISAEEEALVPLSELASLRGEETQQFIGEQMEKLFLIEQMPDELRHREWRAFDLTRTLYGLDSEIGADDFYDEAFSRIWHIEQFWERYCNPPDAPQGFNTSGRFNYDKVDNWRQVIAAQQIWLAEESNLVQQLLMKFRAGCMDELSPLLADLRKRRVQEWEE